MAASYNPEMSLPLNPAFDQWLHDGGTIVAASDRAARSLRSAYHRQRSSEGKHAWPSPQILDWSTFLLTAWSLYTQSDCLVLNHAQEQKLWADIISRESSLTGLLPEARDRMAQLALQGYSSLCAYAPTHLAASARKHWVQDKASFSKWIDIFEETCRARNLISPSKVPLELLPRLVSDSSARAPLLAVGFDRLQPTQESFLQACGPWQLADPSSPAHTVRYWSASDSLQELEGCASWCGRFLREHASARILVIAQNMDRMRGSLQRAFMEHLPGDSTVPYEFSLGIPLAEADVPKAFHLMLRWLSEPLEEGAIDWLFTTGISASSQQETLALQAAMRSLRDAGMQRPSWKLSTFIQASHRHTPIPLAWSQRMSAAQKQLQEVERPIKRPSEWSEWAAELIHTMRPQDTRDFSSAEYQSLRRWNEALDTCASLGFDGARVSWRDFLAALSHGMTQTLFAPESEDAPVLVTGPSESAGLQADAIWFLDVDEDTWPSSGFAHPLLPIDLQRKAGMPHSDPLQEWAIADAMTTRIIGSAPVVQFSYSRRKESLEQRPSRIVLKHCNVQTLLHTQMPAWARLQTAEFTDAAQIPLQAHQAAGGSGILTSQSQCAFQAFARYRLGAQNWDVGRPSLTPAQRGRLLHAVLHAIWSDSPDSLRSLEDLQRRLPDLDAFVATHVRRLVPGALKVDVQDWMPARYLELERLRLTHLISEWLRYEATRIPFTVVGVEAPKVITIQGLSLRLRLDRIDRLTDGSTLVIDYKTGDVSTNEWETPRPSDVQLPLYATFAIRESEQLGGLTFAKLRAGQNTYAGYFANPSETLFADLKPTHGFRKNPLTQRMLAQWKQAIEELAEDYMQGRADVDPRNGDKTCASCGLQTLCRIHELSHPAGDEAEKDEAVLDA